MVNHIIAMEQKIVEALVYAALAQGIRAGVRPYQAKPEEIEEGYPTPVRAVFIEYPGKTIEWSYAEVQSEFLDSFPQHER